VQALTSAVMKMVNEKSTARSSKPCALNKVHAPAGCLHLSQYLCVITGVWHDFTAVLVGFTVCAYDFLLVQNYYVIITVVFELILLDVLH